MQKMGHLGSVNGGGEGGGVMGKVMDVKQMFLEAKGMYSPPVQPAFKSSWSASPRNIIGAHWNTSGSLQHRYCMGPSGANMTWV